MNSDNEIYEKEDENQNNKKPKRYVGEEHEDNYNNDDEFVDFEEEGKPRTGIEYTVYNLIDRFLPSVGDKINQVSRENLSDDGKKKIFAGTALVMFLLFILFVFVL